MVTVRSQITTVLSFLNTLNLVAGHDAFRDHAKLSEWLGEHGLLQDPPVHDLALAVEVREAVRDLLQSGSAPSYASGEVLERAAGMAQVSLRFESGGAAIRPTGSGLDRAIAEFLIAVYSVMADGTWERIRVCRNPECRWAFFDQSRNRARMWCAMAECGNKMKARRFRRRGGPRLTAGQEAPGRRHSGEQKI
jgi:predicted RNA-binding Zn ribbon-like protein